jgi:hypothetical protein
MDLVVGFDFVEMHASGAVLGCLNSNYLMRLRRKIDVSHNLLDVDISHDLVVFFQSGHGLNDGLLLLAAFGGRSSNDVRLYANTLDGYIGCIALSSLSASRRPSGCFSRRFRIALYATLFGRHIVVSSSQEGVLYETKKVRSSNKSSLVGVRSGVRTRSIAADTPVFVVYKKTLRQ